MTKQKTRPGPRSRLANCHTSQSTRPQSSSRVLRKKRITGSEQKKSFQENSRSSLARKSNDIARVSPAKEQKAYVAHCAPPRIQTGIKLPVTETEVSSFAEEEDKSTSRAARESSFAKHESRRMNSSQPPWQQDELAGNQETLLENDTGDETELDEDADEAAFKSVQAERRRYRAWFSDEDHVELRASFELGSSEANSFA